MSVTNQIPLFFLRNQLWTRDVAACLDFATEEYCSHVFDSIQNQGGCSWTLLAKPRSQRGGEQAAESDKGSSWMVQFRLLKHAIPVHLAIEASRIYSPLVPKIRDLGRLTVGDGVCLQAVEMARLPGTRFSELQPTTPAMDRITLKRYKSLIQSIAEFMARSWDSGRVSRKGLELCTGRVGRSLLSRLRSLETDLPLPKWRAIARLSKEAVQRGILDVLPIGLTHGDFVPSNMLVDPETWAVTGYVDWAEVEYLPIGICLYGLEHLLGYLKPVSRGSRKPRFVYYDQADEIREAFWETYEQLVPAIENEKVRMSLELSRTVGILLWKGLAWDDGAIDRVINPSDDTYEMACLEGWLLEGARRTRRDSFVQTAESS